MSWRVTSGYISVRQSITSQIKMKCLLFTFLVTLAVSKVFGDKGLNAVVERVEDGERSCKMAITSADGVAGGIGGGGSSPIYYLISGTATGAKMAQDDTFFACTINSDLGATGTNIVFSDSTKDGYCGNYTVTSTVTTASQWSDDDYKFNCTTGTFANAAQFTCTIWFDMGKLALDIPTSAKSLTGFFNLNGITLVKGLGDDAAGTQDWGTSATTITFG